MRRYLHRSHNIDTHSGTAARCIDSLLYFGKPFDTGGVLSPLLQPLFPAFGSLFCIGFGILAFCCRLIPDPGLKSSRRKCGICQAEIPHIPLGVNDNRGDIVYRRLFDDADTQACFPAAGHTDNGSMGRKIFIFQKCQCLCRLQRLLVNIFSHIKKPEFFIYRFIHTLSFVW